MGNLTGKILIALGLSVVAAVVVGWISGLWWLSIMLIAVGLVQTYLVSGFKEDTGKKYAGKEFQVDNFGATRELLRYLNQEMGSEFDNALRENQQVRDILADAINKLVNSFTELERQSGRQQELAAVISGTGVSMPQDEQVNFNSLFKNIETILTRLIDAIVQNSLAATGLSESMAQTQQQFKSIQGMLHDVRKIADQTNLLAVNASVEAARAGAAGKGFSVVAEEVRNLSIRSNRFSDQIYDSVQGIASSLAQVEHTIKQLATTSDELATTERERVATILDQTVSFHDKVNTSAAEIGEISRSVSQQVGAAVTSMQFQDMATQVLETVTRRLDALAHLMESLANLDVDLDAEEVTGLNEQQQHMLKLQRMLREASAIVRESQHNPVSQKSMDEGDIELF